MNSIFKIAVLFLSLTLIQCSSDDETDAGELTVNGAPFKLDNIAYLDGNEITTNFKFQEKDGEKRSIRIFAMHESGNASGTYQLRSNLIEPGIANIRLFNDQSQQIAGGATAQPTGTLTITHLHHDRYTVTFNDVTLDPGTANETTISGSVTKNFTRVSQN